MSSGTASAPGSAPSAFQQPPDISSPVAGASQQQSAAAGQDTVGSSEASELHQQAAAPQEAGRVSQEAGTLPHGLQLQQLQSNLLRPAMPQLAKAAGAALGLADQGQCTFYSASCLAYCPPLSWATAQQAQGNMQ